MSYIYSRALVEEYLPVDSSGTDAYVPLSGNPMPRPCLWHDKTMEVSRHSRYGMTCRPSTATLGRALLMWWQEGFRAKTSALPEKAQESTEPEAECGHTWRGWLAKFDPVSCSWKTAQLSLIGDLGECLATFPRSGMTRGGLLWELPMLERPTNETGSGCLLPTPVSIDAGSGRFNTSVGSSNKRPTLALMARKNLWPTPTAHNAKETNAPSESLRNTPTLAAQAGGPLNPDWTEWLMGWPIEWTALKPSGTVKFQPAPQPRGELLEGLEA